MSPAVSQTARFCHPLKAVIIDCIPNGGIVGPAEFVTQILETMVEFMTIIDASIPTDKIVINKKQKCMIYCPIMPLASIAIVGRQLETLIPLDYVRPVVTLNAIKTSIDRANRLISTVAPSTIKMDEAKLIHALRNTIAQFNTTQIVHQMNQEKNKIKKGILLIKSLDIHIYTLRPVPMVLNEVNQVIPSDDPKIRITIDHFAQSQEKMTPCDSKSRNITIYEHIVPISAISVLNTLT